MIKTGLSFYTRPQYKVTVLEKLNEKLFLVEQTDLIAKQSRNDLLLSPEEIQEELNNQEAIIKIVERSLEWNKEQEQKRELEKLKEREEQEKYNFCYGYCDNKKPLQAGKILKALNKSVRIDGKYTTRKDFIYSKVKEGYNVEIIDQLLTNERKINLERVATYKYNVPVLRDDNGYYIITKTEYDYALYLIQKLLQTA